MKSCWRWWPLYVRCCRFLTYTNTLHFPQLSKMDFNKNWQKTSWNTVSFWWLASFVTFNRLLIFIVLVYTLWSTATFYVHLQYQCQFFYISQGSERILSSEVLFVSNLCNLKTKTYIQVKGALLHVFEKVSCLSFASYMSWRCQATSWFRKWKTHNGLVMFSMKKFSMLKHFLLAAVIWKV